MMVLTIHMNCWREQCPQGLPGRRLASRQCSLLQGCNDICKFSTWTGLEAPDLAVASFQRFKPAFSCFLGVPNGSCMDSELITPISKPSSEGNWVAHAWEFMQQVFLSSGMILCPEMHPSSCHVRVHSGLLQASAFALGKGANDRCWLGGAETHSVPWQWAGAYAVPHSRKLL